MNSKTCLYCEKSINPEDPSTWKEVKGWVGGPRKDSMRLRKDTGYYAHDTCVQRVMQNMPPEQPDLFEEAESPSIEARPTGESPLDEEALGGYEEPTPEERDLLDRLGSSNT